MKKWIATCLMTLLLAMPVVVPVHTTPICELQGAAPIEANFVLPHVASN